MKQPAQAGVRPVEFGTTGFYPAFTGANNARVSEQMGFDIQGFSENHMRVPDCLGEMRDAIRQTTTIKLACGPVNFVTRNPGVVASGLLPIQILSGGRAICGVASGDSAVAAAGMRPQGMEDLERDLHMLRRYLDGETVVFEEFGVDSSNLDWAVGMESSHLEWAEDIEYDRVPIQMACSGPKSIALAARWADRICLGIGMNLDLLAWATEIIESQLDACGRSRDEIRIGLFSGLAITSDRTSGRQLIKSRVGASIHWMSGHGTDLSKQPEILRRATSAMRGNYDYRFHTPKAPPGNPNSKYADEDLGDWLGIGGPPTYVLDKMGELVNNGVDFFMTALPMPEREIFSSEVMPVLRTLRQ